VSDEIGLDLCVRLVLWIQKWYVFYE